MPKRPLNTRQSLYRKLIQPRSDDQDERRREFILNVIICGLALITFVALLSSAVNELSGNRSDYLNSLFLTAGFWLFMLILWWLSRRGYHRLAAWIVLGLFGLAALSLMLMWSFELPEAELTYAAIIMLATVLLKPRAALLTAVTAAAVVLLLATLQVYQVLHPNTAWLDQKLEMVDAVGFVAIFAIIALVSWLANREIDHSLRRARASEAALAKERDSLEIKVRERTAELEQSQLARVLELQRFAEFGRLSAELLHEVSNPLMAASLNVDLLGTANHTDTVAQIKRNLRHLSRYLDAARKQLKVQGRRTNFSIRSELDQVRSMVRPQAKKLGVQLDINLADNYRLYGDPVKFNQLAANLITNALEAYVGLSRAATGRVVVAVTKERRWLIVTITDWGMGIPATHLPHLFEPFFSTKLAVNRGLGIGLALVKQIAEEEFGGSITASSSPKEGTKFIVKLRDAAAT